MMDCLSINRNEVLRYLGYQDQIIEESINELIDNCINEVKKLTKAKYIYKYFNIIRGSERIQLEKCSLDLKGDDIYKHLKDSDSCVLMATTLGNLIDMRIRYYEKTHITKALILDACANVAIEEVCDRVCLEIEDVIKRQNKKLNSRYSPGYGDLPLEIQSKFITVLEANKVIGLTATSNNILIPRKSVTAIMGVIDMDQEVANKSCSSCNKYFSCNFRRDGEICGV